MIQHDRGQRFTGTVTGNVRWELSDDCQPHQPVRTHWAADGELAPLGRSTAVATHCADDRGGGHSGRLTFAAANGDTLLAAYTFKTVSMTPTLVTMEMTGSFIDGGTGRFAHASGSFVATVRAHTTTVPPTIETTWPLELTFDGMVEPGTGER